VGAYGAAALLGLGPGGVYAVLGLGLVLVYRSSGVVHLAQGALAMFTTYEFAELRDVGDLVFPVVGMPPRLHLSDHPTFALAFGVSLGMAVVLGLGAYLLVFRPLRGAPPVTTVVAGVGVMIAFEAVAVIQFGSDQRFVAPVLPRHPLSVFGTTVPSDRLLLAAIAVAAAAALWAVSRWTRFGLATLAVSEDPEALALLGSSPVAVGAVNWAMATVLGGLAGILIAPINAPDPLTYTLLVVPALAAALVGRLSSFAVTVAAAFGLGVAQSILLPLSQDLSWLNQPGLRDGLPFVVIAVVAVRRGQLVPGRGAAAPSRPLPAAAPAPRPLRGLVIGVPAAVVALLVLPGAYQIGLERSFAGAAVCLSFVVLTGYVGQLSLAQTALAGLAGFTLARLASLHVPFPLAPLLATAAAAAAGGVLGLVARRVRGVDLAVVTLAAGVTIQEMVFASPVLTGGLAGSHVPSPRVFGLRLGLDGGSAGIGYGLLALTVLAACCYGVARLRGGDRGRRMLAVRSNERAAAAAGVDVSRTKLAAFVLSAGLAGLGGCLIGYGQGQLSYDSFGVSASLLFLAVAAVGGVTAIRGALLGGLLIPGGLAFTAADRLAHIGRYQLLISGLALLVTVVLAPAGLAARRAGLGIPGAGGPGVGRPRLGRARPARTVGGHRRSRPGLAGG
jgi:branched-chain amino acid transport system permease protein